MQEFLKMWQNALNFQGRTSRREFWMAYLFNLIFELTIIYAYVSWFPLIALSVRRLHDIGKSGWWLLLHLIPFVGTIILIVYFCQPSVENFSSKTTHGKEPEIQVKTHCKYCGLLISPEETICPGCGANQADKLLVIKKKLDNLKKSYERNEISKEEYEKQRNEILEKDW